MRIGYSLKLCYVLHICATYMYYLFDNIVLPLYGSWLYCVVSYYDYRMNTSLYIQYPDLLSKLDTVAMNIFVWWPVSVFTVTTLQPVSVYFNSLPVEVFHIVTNLIVGDIWFYTLHRLCHHPWLYFLHRQHHEVIHPVGVLALYSHPFDAIVINMGSLFLLHLLLHFSYFQIMMIGTIAMVSTIINSHTGRRVYGHQIHHKYRNCNYGVGIFMDRLLLTNRDA
jgi:sterol desaturase/sphingolipid hydroxylase (fatty acid hydroxylase superfamily)